MHNHNKMSGNRNTVVQAEVINGSVTAPHQCPARLEFLQSVDLLGSSASFQQVAALTMLHQLTEENPDLLIPTLMAVVQ